MNRNLKRMLFALFATATAYAGTEYWYRSGLIKLHSNGGKAAVATLSQSVNEVQRKEARRVIWESITLNDELFPGEAIRTTEKAEAQIRLKSGTTVHLEPDSLIVLEENGNGLSLDFLKGNLFVQGGDKGDGSAEDLTLKTGSGQIKLKSADMSLSKDTSGQVNLEVFKGQAELEQGSQKMALAKDKSATLTEKGMAENKDRLQLLAPQAGETILLNLTRGEKIDLSWKPLDPSYKVAAEIGLSRAGLKRVGDLNANGDAGKMSLAQKPGKWFLRLVAQSNDKAKPQLVSMVVPFTVEPKAPPMLIEPNAQAPVLKKQADEEVEFQWTNRNRYSGQVLEISKDPAFKTAAVHESLKGDVMEYATKLADGTYYWRVTGFLKVKGKDEALASTANKFEVISHLEIKAAMLLAPPNHAHISYFDAQKSGVNLKWQASQGGKTFKVLVQRKSGDSWTVVNEREVEMTAMRLSDLKPGLHQWKITTQDPSGDGGGKASETFEFNVDDVPKLEWVHAEPTLEYIFTTPTPSLSAQWNAVPGAASYRYRVSPADLALEDTSWLSTKQDKFEISLKEEGKYIGAVEALNAKGQTIAESDIKTFVVKRAPLLPPPRWTESSPPTFKTDAKGNLSFSWEQVDGAKQYLMILENADGKPIEERAVSRNTASVNRLKPGQYRVKLKSIDAFQRLGTEGEPKKLEVPNASDIKAPKIKAMKVK